MLCGWEGNRRSGVALAMRHRLQWFIQPRAQGLRKGDEHPAYAPYEVSLLYLYYSELQLDFRELCMKNDQLERGCRDTLTACDVYKHGIDTVCF